MTATAPNTNAENLNRLRARTNAAAAITDEDLVDLDHILGEAHPANDDVKGRDGSHVVASSAELKADEKVRLADVQGNPLSPKDPATVESNSSGLKQKTRPLRQPPCPNVSKNGDGKEPVLHRFSPKVAEWVGAAAATVFQFIHWHCHRHGQYTGTYEDLLKEYPYISRKQLQLIIHKLTDDSQFDPLLLCRRVRGRNRYKYVLVDPKMKLGRTHSFDPDFALKYDVNMAVIYDNLVYWINENDENGDCYQPNHYESPAQWARAHPYIPLRTVERCFAKLTEAGEILEFGRTRPDNIPVWTIPLGIGKLDRWLALHRASKKKDQKEVATVTKYVYVNGIYDPDEDEIDSLGGGQKTKVNENNSL